MENLVFKPITDDNIEPIAKLCGRSFDTQRGTVSDELFADGIMGSALYEVMKEPHVDGWAIYDAEELVGGAVIKIGENNSNELELFFFDASLLGHGYGTRAWFALEKMYPDTRLWTTITPLSAVKNLMFYVNKCGFHITKIVVEENEKICLFEKAMM